MKKKNIETDIDHIVLCNAVISKVLTQHFSPPLD